MLAPTTTIASPRAGVSVAGHLGFLAALQLADSAFPAGLYAFSHGLETAAQEGHVRSAQDLERFVEDWLTWQVGPGDATLLVAAHRACTRGATDVLLEIDAYCAATKLAREAREASVKTGGRLLATATTMVPAGSVVHRLHDAVRRGQTPGTYAIAFGATSAALGVGEATAVLADLHSAATGLLGAALRLLRIDHQQTQGILRRLAPLLAEIADTAVERAADWRSARPCGPFVEVLQMRHEAAHVRLFMS